MYVLINAWNPETAPHMAKGVFAAVIKFRIFSWGHVGELGGP